MWFYRTGTIPTLIRPGGRAVLATPGARGAATAADRAPEAPAWTVASSLPASAGGIVARMLLTWAACLNAGLVSPLASKGGGVRALSAAAALFLVRA